MTENLSDFLDQNVDSFELPKKEKTNENELIEYRPRPADSKDEDGVYRSTIRIFRDLREQGPSATFNVKRTYFFSHNGISLPWDIQEKNDPAVDMFYALKNHPNAQISSQVADTKNDDRLFKMSIADYVMVQVIKDANKPDLEGKYMVWKLPKAIKELIQARTAKKIKPDFMDPVLGFALNLEVTPGPDDPNNPQRKTREIKYSASEFELDMIQPLLRQDGTSFLTDEQFDALNALAINMNKVTKKGVSNADKKTMDTLTKQWNENKDLINSTIQEQTKYLTELGDECVSSAKFVQPKPHTNEDLIRFTDMAVKYMRFIGCNDDDVSAILDRVKLSEYWVENQWKRQQAPQPANQTVSIPEPAAPAPSEQASDLPF